MKKKSVAYGAPVVRVLGPYPLRSLMGNFSHDAEFADPRETEEEWGS